MVAVQNEANLWMAYMRVTHAVDDGLRSMVASHGINRDDEFTGQTGAILHAEQQAPQ